MSKHPKAVQRSHHGYQARFIEEPFHIYLRGARVVMKQYVTDVKHNLDAASRRKAQREISSYLRYVSKVFLSVADAISRFDAPHHWQPDHDPEGPGGHWVPTTPADQARWSKLKVKKQEQLARYYAQRVFHDEGAISYTKKKLPRKTINERQLALDSKKARQEARFLKNNAG